MKKDQKQTLVSDTNISTDAKNALVALGVNTIDDLHLMYVLDTLPELNTNISVYPSVSKELVYTTSISVEVIGLLSKYCNLSMNDLQKLTKTHMHTTLK